MIEGPIQINRQNSQRRWVVQGNVTGRALSEVVEDIRQAISQKVNLPTGYFIEFGGQFENQQRAMGKLKIIIPVVIGVIFLLLWLTFNSIRHASIVILNVPMALIGGVTGLILTGQYLSVPASVGFIALFGIAMQDAVVLITDFNDYRKMGLELNSAIVDGAMIRFRAVLMTTLTTLLGLLPLLLSTSAGSEIQRPLAATVVFGLASSTLLTLYVIPSVYKIVEEKYLMHLPEKGLETTNGE
jgi:cobalt-zinc-cadmium resistance protein CzcA